MSETFPKIVALVAAGDWQVSDHGLQRLEENAILGSDLEKTIADGQVVEDYPDYHAGPSVLVLQSDRTGPVHTLWGLRKGTDRPAVLVTAYRPDSKRWREDNRSRT